VKLKYLKAYESQDIPDHIRHEIFKLSERMIQVLKPIIDMNNPNITLAAMNYVHASLVRMLVSDDEEELIKAAKLTAISLLKNIEALSNFNVEKDE
jgi:hypothetical protein